MLSRRRPAAALGSLAVLLILSSCSRSDASTSTQETSEQPAEESTGSSEEPDPLADLENRSFPLLVWAAHVVDQEYFDKERFDARAQLLFALETLGLHTPAFFAEESGNEVVVTVRSASKTFALQDVETLGQAADRLEEVLEFAATTLDLEGEPRHELEYAAINGLFAPLDPHTILLTPEEHADLGVRTKGEFGGIGAEIRAERRRIVVMRVLPKMPAETSGLRAGDVIMRIDGVSTVNMTAQEAQQLLRGPVGTEVLVRVRRGKKTLELPIERNTIRIDSVVSTELPDRVAYVRITTFQENTGQQVREALQSMGTEDEGALAGLVLDLRGNSGGLLVQATEVVDQFVDDGELVVVRSALGREADPADEDQVLPQSASVVVLIDEESASAAEIVSGGLKALGRGVVLGRSSFGKGTVQVVRPAAPYGRELALKLTIAEYLVAGDKRIQTRGVVPDLELLPVELTRIPGVVRYFDVERFERQRERSRIANLPSARHELSADATAEPPASLSYLWSDEAGGSDGAGAALEASESLPEQMSDPEIRLAREVAVALAGAADPESRQAKLRSVASRLAAQEDARIVEAFGDSDVQWGQGVIAAGTPELVLTASLTDKKPIPAGEPFTLRVQVENTGDAPAHRVHVITDCMHDELDGIELMVGTVEPGAKEVREVKLHVMPWHSDFTGQLELALHVGGPDEEPDATHEVMFEVAGAPRPSLATDYWIVDDPKWAAKSPKRPPASELSSDVDFEVTGNGDGMLQPGERALLVFVARNAGPGNSPDVRAILRNLSGTQGLIEEGMFEVGELATGKDHAGAFGISINDTADPSLPFELELMVGDATLRTAAQDKLRLRIPSSAQEAEPDEKGYVVTGEAIRLYAGAHPGARIVAEVEPGVQLHSTSKIGDWRVFETADQKRRLFAPSDLKALVATEGVTQTQWDRIVLRPGVLPPSIELEKFPGLTSAAKVSIKGYIEHPQRVRDVVVLVRAPGPSQVDRKVHYQAADPGAIKLEFATDVPLEPGGNRITILARDAAKVEHRRDIWVFRDK